MTAPDDYHLELLSQRRYIRALASRLVFDADLAPDVEQEVLLAAFANAPRDRGALRGWLASLVRNLAQKSWRTTRRRVAREHVVARPEAAVPSPSEILEREEQRQRLVALVLALDEPVRAIIVLRFFEELPPREVARRLALPVETVRTRTKRGLALLREHLDREYGRSRRRWCLLFVHGLQLPVGKGRVASGLGASACGIVKMSSFQKTVSVAAALLAVLAGAGYAWHATRGDQLPPAASRATAAPEAAPLVVAEGPTDATRPQVLTHELRTVVETGAPETGSVLLRVSWHDGTPAAGIGVDYRPVDKDWYDGTSGLETDAEGMCRIAQLAPGKYAFLLDRNVWPSATVQAGQQTDLAVAIPHGHDVDGIVVDAQGLPVVGADILVGPYGGLAHVLAHSGVDGRFRIRSITRDSCFVSARTADRAPTPQVRVHRVDPARGPKMIELRLVFLTAGGALEGTIVDQAGRPVTRGHVMVGREQRRVEWVQLPDGRRACVPRPQLVAVDGAGRFRATGVAAGEQPVRIRAAGFAPWQGSVLVCERQVVHARIVLDAGTRVEGTVRNARGEPIARLPIVLAGEVGLHHRWTLTADDGSFALDDLPVGEFELVVYQDGAPRGAATRFVGAPGAARRWDPVLGGDLAIRGRILASAAELPRITVRCESGTSSWTTDPDANGCFEFADLPDAKYRIEVIGGLYNYPVAVAADVRPATEQLVIEIDRARWPSIRLTGRVVDARGRPVAGAPVQAIPDTSLGASGTRIQWKTEADGTFDIGPYPPGRWRVGIGPTRQPLVVSEQATVPADQTWHFGNLAIGR